jgi:uncharacterized ion transporter superfamily protein YfcC
MCFLFLLLYAAGLTLVYIVLEWGVKKLGWDLPERAFQVIQVIFAIWVIIGLLECLGIFGGRASFEQPPRMFPWRSCP